MKWGVRKDRGGTSANSRETIVTKTKSGAEITLDRTRTPAFAKFLAKLSPKIQKTLENSKSFKISVDGKMVGELDLYKESPDSLNIVWVSVSRANEGKGYGTAVTKAAIDYAKRTKCKQVTLEVPGESPNARHIYEKLGFRDTGEALGDEDDVWGGLTKMRLAL
jgi:RimJ/RimL family protein N-acetyltransferase